MAGRWWWRPARVVVGATVVGAAVAATEADATDGAAAFFDPQAASRTTPARNRATVGREEAIAVTLRAP